MGTYGHSTCVGGLDKLSPLLRARHTGVTRTAPKCCLEKQKLQISISTKDELCSAVVAIHRFHLSPMFSDVSAGVFTIPQVQH